MGKIRYTPDPGFLGTDSLQYTVEDPSGLVSNVATLTISVVESNLQNPVEFMDVNASGEVTALDALLIVNRLAADPTGSGSVPVTAGDIGPNFYDVNGDGVITALDALLVINNVANQQNAGSGEGENVASLDTPIDSPSMSTISRGTVNEIETFESVTDKIVSQATLSPVDTSVIDRIVESDDEEDEAEQAGAIDEALLDLLD